MRRSAVVLSQDAPTLQGLKAALEDLRVSQVTCQSGNEAMELVMAGGCSTLIVDFDFAGAADIVRMAALVQPPHKPLLLAVASRAWPGTGQAFQSGADRILYKPLDMEQVKDAFETSRQLKPRNKRKAPRHAMNTIVYLELATGTVPAIGINLSEHGFAVQATEPIPMLTNLAFRFVLPGTHYEMHGHADVIWASDQGRAGLFLSELAPLARKQLKHWLTKHGDKPKDAAHALVPPADDSLCLAASE